MKITTYQCINESHAFNPKYTKELLFNDIAVRNMANILNLAGVTKRLPINLKISLNDNKIFSLIESGEFLTNFNSKTIRRPKNLGERKFA